ELVDQCRDLPGPRQRITFRRPVFSLPTDWHLPFLLKPAAPSLFVPLLANLNRESLSGQVNLWGCAWPARYRPVGRPHFKDRQNSNEGGNDGQRRRRIRRTELNPGPHGEQGESKPK